MSQTFRTVPEDTEGMPSGVPYIIGNEMAERFSYYGMRSILPIYMTRFLVDASGHLDVMTEDQATANTSIFYAAVYIFPMLGAILCDGLLGKYRTILWVSLLYCLGHAVLSFGGTEPGNAVGLTPPHGADRGIVFDRVGVLAGSSLASRQTSAINSARATGICWKGFTRGFTSRLTSARHFPRC